MEAGLLHPPENLKDELATIDRSSVSPGEQNRLTIGVLRKILLTGWIQIPAIRSALNSNANQSRSERHARREDRKLLNSNLIAHRKNLKLGKVTLAKMNILPVPTITHSFAFYSFLPPEMQAHLLSFLDNPLDKLNVVEAIPLVDLLMRWDVAELELEAFTIPKLLESEGNWKILQQLRTTSPHLRKAINKRIYPHFLAQKSASVGITAIPLTHFQPSERWVTLDPITAQVLINIGDADYVENVLHPLENWIGPRVSDCYLDCFGHVANIQLIQRIGLCLERTPNVQRLFIGTWIDDQDTEWEGIENLTMPGLPSLKILGFREGLGGGAKPICNKLLQCYAPQLDQVVMHFGLYFDRPIPEAFQHAWPAFPQLTTWKMESSPFDNCWKFHCDKMEKLVGSPLKIVRIVLYPPSNDDQKDFVDFLKILSANFGSTLEQISIRARDFRLWQKVPVTKWQENMGNLNFPKVTYLAIDQGCTECRDFLMFFPALEKLIFTKAFDYQDSGQLAKDVNGIVELSSDLQTLRHANVWKLFPNLLEIGIISDVIREQMMVQEEERIFRHECIDAQRK